MADNVQLYQVHTRIVPNFKLAKAVSNKNADTYQKLLDNTLTGAILEKKNHKRGRKNVGDVITTYKISNAEGYDNTDPLTEFDRAVLSVCGGYYEEGFKHVTVPMILRGLTGKKGGDAQPSVDQYNAIMHSVTKLMGTLIDIDDSETNELLGYDKGKSITRSAILPAQFVETTVNGQKTATIKFDRISPLIEIGKKRKQLLTFDSSVLNVPNQNNTPMNIALKNYALVRIVEIKQHTLTPTLTFDDIFKKCRIPDSSKKNKFDARNTLTKFFQHLQDIGFISSFEVVKEHTKFKKIIFAYKAISPPSEPA